MNTISLGPAGQRSWDGDLHAHERHFQSGGSREVLEVLEVPLVAPAEREGGDVWFSTSCHPYRASGDLSPVGSRPMDGRIRACSIIDPPRFNALHAGTENVTTVRTRRYQKGELIQRKQESRTVWIGRYYDRAGKRRMKVLGSVRKLTKTQAQTELDRLLPPVMETPDPTLREFLDAAYYPFKRARWKSDSTRQTTEQRIETHLEPLMDKRVSTIRRHELQALIDSKVEGQERLSFSVIDHLRGDLHAIFEMARNDSIVTGDQATSLFTPVEARRPDKAVLTADQVALLLNELDLRPRLIVSLAILCGMRPGEILGLRWSDISNDHAEVSRRVYKGSVGTPKTYRSVRRVAFSASVVKDLAAWRNSVFDRSTPDAWIFASENGSPLWRDNVLRRMLLPTLRKLKLQWATFQVMRRTYSTLAKLAGVDAKTRAAQMGHGVDVNENEYTQTPLAQLAEAVAAVERTVSAAKPN